MTAEQLSIDIENYHNMVYRLAFGCLGNRFDADDVTQDVFIKLYRHKKPLLCDEHKKAFLVRTTVNQCKDIHKSAWFRKRTELDESLPVHDNFDECEYELSEYIQKLKPHYRAVIFLHYYEGYTTSEIAKMLNVTQSTVTTRLSRARNQLKTQLITNKGRIIYE